MPSYLGIIAECERDVNALRDALSVAVRARAKSPAHQKAWEEAASAYRGYRSKVHDLVDQCKKADLSEDENLREFAFDMISYYPQFPRSGQLLSTVLRRVKKLSFTEAEKTLVQDVIKQRIETEAGRNFRQVCLLIPMIENPSFLADIQELGHSDDSKKKRSADFALKYFPT